VKRRKQKRGKTERSCVKKRGEEGEKRGRKEKKRGRGLLSKRNVIR
jgi:hypothetical protein